MKLVIKNTKENSNDIEFIDNNFYLIEYCNRNVLDKLFNTIGGFSLSKNYKLYVDDVLINKKNLSIYNDDIIGILTSKIPNEKKYTIQNYFELIYATLNKKIDFEVIENYFKKVEFYDDNVNFDEILQLKIGSLTTIQKIKLSLIENILVDSKIILFNFDLNELNSNELDNMFNSFIDCLINKILIVFSTFKNSSTENNFNCVISLDDFNNYSTGKNDLNIESENKILELKKEKSKINNLSFNEKIKFSFLNYKKLNIFVSLFFSVFIILLNFAFIFSTTDLNEISLRNQIDNNDSDGSFLYKENCGFSITLKHGYRKDHYAVNFEEDEITKIKDYSNNCVGYVIDVENGVLKNSIRNNLDTIPSYLLKYPTNQENSFIEIDDDINDDQLSSFGLTRYSKLEDETECRMPNSYTEVAISDFLAEVLVKCGLVTKLDDNGIKEWSYVTKCDELIGKNLSNGLTIVGIYSSSDKIFEEFSEHLSLTTEEFEKLENFKYYKNILNGYSLSQYAYVKEGYAESLGYKNSTSLIYCSLKLNYSKDIAFLNSFKKDFNFVKLFNKYYYFIYSKSYLSDSFYNLFSNSYRIFNFIKYFYIK